MAFIDADIPETLRLVLEQSQRFGFLGPGPIESHVSHALRFVGALSEPPVKALDLGSGGGVPGLVLARIWQRSEWVLFDAMKKRCVFLCRAVQQLELSDRVSVVEGRAEESGRSSMRGAFDLVTARSFGPPATTAECAAPFLREGGRLAVSEPPDPGYRWPEAGLQQLGLRRVSEDEAAIAVMQQVKSVDGRFPRRDGVPAKRPLF